MNKQQISRAFTYASSEELADMAKTIVDRYEVYSLEEPRQTLVMVQVREHVQQTRFLLGEVLATTCRMEVNGQAGLSVLMGSNNEKVRHAAILDAALNASVEEAESLMEELQAILEREKAKRQRQSDELNKTLVDFNLMA